MSLTTPPSAVALPQLDVGPALSVVREQLHKLVTNHPNRIPIYTRNGRWHFDSDEWAPVWTGGFLAGMLWLVANHTDDSWWQAQAKHYSQLIEPRKDDSGTHDIGFLFTPSWARWHAIEPTSQTRDVLIRAGRTLADSFNPQGRYLKTWVAPGSTFIDIMMNVDIIYQAAELAGDPELEKIATQHALTSRRYLVRGDSSTVHEGWFDETTGEFLRAATHQGFRGDSCWARGHAWAIYGFGAAYLRTGDQRFLRTAVDCADMYIDRTGIAYVPPNDWDDPSPRHPYEASAGSIAAAAMLQLGECLGSRNAGHAYLDYGTRILSKLMSPQFLADPQTGWDGVVKQATYHSANNLGVQESNMWGDHYFVEAIVRYLSLRPDFAP
jgi:unsaturated chondroitin disaccharide hydrolase